MGSLTRWTWVWVNSGSWRWTGRPGLLRFMGSQRVGHDWVTNLNWTELNWTSLKLFWSDRPLNGSKEFPGILGAYFVSYWSRFEVITFLLPLGEPCEKTLPNRNAYDLFKDNRVILTKNVVKSSFSLHQIVSLVPDHCSWTSFSIHKCSCPSVGESGICSCIAAVFYFHPICFTVVFFLMISFGSNIDNY